jgi:hypothetical protein
LDYLIHGGLTKTGSSSIQAFLLANRDLLAGRGVHYPRGYLDIHARQHSPIAVALKEGRPEEVRRFARASLADATAAGASRVVWSGELLGAMRPQDMPALVDIARGPGGAQDVRIILYFRNLYDRLLSRMNQQTKMGDVVFDDARIERLTRANPSDLVRAWEAAAGVDNVDVRIFDLAVRTGLERDFLRAIGVEWSDEFELLPPANSSLDPITAQVLNLLRVEWMLPAGLVRACERRSKAYRLPETRRRTVQPLREAVERTDLSHPKLAPYRDVLTELKDPASIPGPSLPEFLDDLIATLTYLREESANPDTLVVAAKVRGRPPRPLRPGADD